MQARALNRMVTIQQLETGQDAAGQPSTDWETVCSTLANIRHLSGLEAIKAGAETSVVKASIRVRRRTDVTAAMRVVHGSTTYEIKAVLPDEVDRVYMDLACEVLA